MSRKNPSKKIIEIEKIKITVLFRRASARYSAPLSPILFSLRLSVVSVYVENRTGKKRDYKDWFY